MLVMQMLGGSPYGGGVPVILDSIRGIRGLGTDVEAIVAASDPHVRATFERHDVRCIAYDLGARGLSPRRDALATSAMVSELRKLRPAVVHTHTTKVGVFGRAAAVTARTRNGGRIAHTVHGFGFNRSTRTAVRDGLILVERALSTKTDALVFVSQYHYDLAKELGIGRKSRLFRIRNGVDADGLERVARDGSSVSGIAGEMRADREAGRLVLFSFGRLSAQKGFDVLVRSLHGAPDLADIRLYIAGDGPLRTQLETAVREADLEHQIRFLGAVQNAYALSLAADLVVLPSRFEGLSIALLEALAVGANVLTSDIPENVEAAGEHGAAYFRSENASDLRRALVEFVNAGKLRVDPTVGQARVRQLFSSSRAVAEYGRMYEELLA